MSEKVSSKTLKEQLEDKTYLDKYSRRILYFFDVEDIVEGLVATLELLEERESKKIADIETALEELSLSKEPDKKLIADLMRTKSQHFGSMMAYVNIQGLLDAKEQKNETGKMTERQAECCDCKHMEVVQGFPPCNECYTHPEYPKIKPKFEQKKETK